MNVTRKIVFFLLFLILQIVVGFPLGPLIANTNLIASIFVPGIVLGDAHFLTRMTVFLLCTCLKYHAQMPCNTQSYDGSLCIVTNIPNAQKMSNVAVSLYLSPYPWASLDKECAAIENTIDVYVDILHMYSTESLHK